MRGVRCGLVAWALALTLAGVACAEANLGTKLKAVLAGKAALGQVSIHYALRQGGPQPMVLREMDLKGTKVIIAHKQPFRLGTPARHLEPIRFTLSKQQLKELLQVFDRNKFASLPSTIGKKSPTGMAATIQLSISGASKTAVAHDPKASVAFRDIQSALDKLYDHIILGARPVQPPPMKAPRTILRQ